VQLLRFNAAQLAYYLSRTLRDIILKPRQLGFTTLICALFVADCLLRPNRVCVIVAHDADSARRIFQIVKLMWERMPAAWRKRYPTRVDNKGEIWWTKTNSRIFVGTAGTPGLGRGLTIHRLLCSEVAHWPHPQEALAALLEAVPADGRVIVESTAAGMNHFHTLWTEAKGGQSEFKPFFFRWFDDPEYRRPDGPPLGELTEDELALCRAHGLDEAQIRWRREKQRQLRDRFMQEYPEDDVSCFLTSGRCCFSIAALTEMSTRARQERPQSIQVMALYGWGMGRRYLRQVNVPPGRLTVWRHPEIAEGLEHGDFSAAVVLDRRTGGQAAELHGKWRPDVFAELVAALAANYGWAYTAVEANNHGSVALHVLDRVLHYPQLYWHVDGFRAGRSVHLGWPTTSKTKALMVDQLAAAIAEGNILLRSPVLLNECTTFVSKDGGAQEAEEGKHDDLVVACGLAWQMRKAPHNPHGVRRPPEWT